MLPPTSRNSRFFRMAADLREIAAKLKAVTGAGPLVCSWCQRQYGYVPDVQGRTSHGICPDCGPRLAAEAREGRS